MKRTPYELALESRISGARPTYRFSTADGVYSKDSFRESELLLVESLWDINLGDLLVLEANYGVVGTILAENADSVHMTETSARAAQLCELNTRRNSGIATTTVVADLTSLNDVFDTAAYAPKPYTPLAVGKQRIANALSVLRPGGSLYLSTSKRTGLTRYKDCLHEIALTVEVLSERDGYRLLEATRPHSFELPRYVSPKQICPEINGVELTLFSVPGLFSASSLDDGTRLLLEMITVEDGDRVLDICCGYGALGTYVGHVWDCEVWLSDDNRIATTCASCSLRASGVEGTVVTADGAEGVADKTFDRVLCNPPTHAGEGVLKELFAGIYDVLSPTGELTVVHHSTLDLRTYFSRFDTIERVRTGNEHVVLSINP